MAINSILPPFPMFFDLAGKPLEAGYIYIGQPGYEARSQPKASFFDTALTVPTGTATGAAVRTSGGYPVFNGAARMIYVDGDFSITVLDRNMALLYTSLSRSLAYAIDSTTVTALGLDDRLLYRAATEPSPTNVGALWFDTGSSILKRRNATNDGWINVSHENSTSPAMISQGVLSGSALVIATPSDIEGIELSYWGYSPSSPPQTLLLSVGSGSVGSPSWGANHYFQTQSVVTTTYTPSVSGPSSSVPASFDQLGSGQIPGSGRITVNGFNVSGPVYGFSERRGVITGPVRATAHASFSEETSVVHSLVRLSVASGTMSGNYRLIGWRK